MLEINSKLWGKNSKNEDIMIYTIKNDYLKIEILNIGAIIKKIALKPEKNKLNKKEKNLVISYDNIESYEKNPAYIGAIIGRTAGRIENALLKIDDKTYKLSENNAKNNLHGGINSISHKIWEIEVKKDRLSCYIESKHLENGFPGNIKIKVDYILRDNELLIEYSAKTDEKTYINMTNHSYFSLSGGEDLIYDDILKINSDYMVKINKDSLPVELMKTENTIFDFKNEKKIGDFFKGEHEQKELANNGIDHPFILNEAKKSPIIIFNKKSGIRMEVETDNPAVVIYTANYFNDIGLENHGAICFETQEIPNLFENKDLNIYPQFIDEKKEYKKYTKFRFIKI